MNIEFKETMPQAEKTEKMIVRGEIVGDITSRSGFSHGSLYHACFNVEGGNIGLIQGFGDTKIEAIQNAIIQGRIDAEKRLVSIAELETKLGLRP